MIGPGKMVAVKPNSIPLIHDRLMDDTISIESVIVLDSLFPFLNKHEKEVTLEIVWPEHIQAIQKYKPFVLEKIDTEFYKSIAKEILL